MMYEIRNVTKVRANQFVDRRPVIAGCNRRQLDSEGTPYMIGRSSKYYPLPKYAYSSVIRGIREAEDVDRFEIKMSNPGYAHFNCFDAVLICIEKFVRQYVNGLDEGLTDVDIAADEGRDPDDVLFELINEETKFFRDVYYAPVPRKYLPSFATTKYHKLKHRSQTNTYLFPNDLLPIEVDEVALPVDEVVVPDDRETDGESDGPIDGPGDGPGEIPISEPSRAQIKPAPEGSLRFNQDFNMDASDNIIYRNTRSKVRSVFHIVEMTTELKCTLTKLNGDNYFNWSYKLKMLLIEKSIWSVIGNAIPAVITDEWRKNDQKAHSIIALNIQDDQIQHFKRVFNYLLDISSRFC